MIKHLENKKQISELMEVFWGNEIKVVDKNIDVDSIL